MSCRFYDLSSDDESGDRFVPRGRYPIDSGSDLSSDSGDDSDLVSVSQQDITLESEELQMFPGIMILRPSLGLTSPA